MSSWSVAKELLRRTLRYRRTLLTELTATEPAFCCACLRPESSPFSNRTPEIASLYFSFFDFDSAFDSDFDSAFASDLDSDFLGSDFSVTVEAEPSFWDELESELPESPDAPLRA